MDPTWLFDQFGTIGLMLAAMLWDRTRLLRQIELMTVRMDVLTDRLIEQAQMGIDQRITQERASVETMERMVRALADAKGA